MKNKHNWYSLDFWANELEKKYPMTDLLSLSYDDLAKMLLSLDKAKGMPELPDDDVYLFALASAWVVVQHGGDDTKYVPDAYI
ncbi:MAG: hypothetical protein J6X79_00575 [Bacteroidales bacterium]|nr:hypothetical protein [Bacteroidales bacterium]